MARVKVDVAVGFSPDPIQAEHIADKNFGLALQHDPSLNQQQVLFESWSFTSKKTGQVMVGCKYYYWAENNSPVVEANHPQLKSARKGKAA
jgi:hypothetical protein